MPSPRRGGPGSRRRGEGSTPERLRRQPVRSRSAVDEAGRRADPRPSKSFRRSYEPLHSTNRASRDPSVAAYQYGQRCVAAGPYPRHPWVRRSTFDDTTSPACAKGTRGAMNPDQERDFIERQVNKNVSRRKFIEWAGKAGIGSAAAVSLSGAVLAACGSGGGAKKIAGGTGG